MTFLGNQESSRSLYAIPGLDYVAHEDIIPYISAEKTPLNHELFDKFLMPNPKGGEFSIMKLLYVQIKILLYKIILFCFVQTKQLLKTEHYLFFTKITVFDRDTYFNISNVDLI